MDKINTYSPDSLFAALVMAQRHFRTPRFYNGPAEESTVNTVHEATIRLAMRVDADAEQHAFGGPALSCRNYAVPCLQWKDRPDAINISAFSTLLKNLLVSRERSRLGLPSAPFDE